MEYLGTAESLYYGEYELKTNEDQNDWSALVEMVDAINNTAIGNLQDTLHPIMDVNSAMAMLAIDNLTVKSGQLHRPVCQLLLLPPGSGRPFRLRPVGSQ